MQDIKKGPPPDNGLEVMYHAATLGERMLGAGEPITGPRGRARLVPPSQCEARTWAISLALCRPSLPRDRARRQSCAESSRPSRVLKLDVAERADVIVEMNNPGVWVLRIDR